MDNPRLIHRTHSQTAYIFRSSYQVLALCVFQDYAIKFVIFAFIIGIVCQPCHSVTTLRS